MIDDLKSKFANGEVEFSRHALDQTLIRAISEFEVEEAVASGTIIENYPNDKYWPSCLVSGRTQTNRPLHVHCTYPTRPIVKVITAYQPDALVWNTDFSGRNGSS